MTLLSRLLTANISFYLSLEIKWTCYLSMVQLGGLLGPGRNHPCRDKTKLQSPASGCWQDTAHTCHRMLLLWRSQPDILQTQKEICMSRWTRTLVTQGNIPYDTAHSPFLQIIQVSLKDQSCWCMDTARFNGHIIISRLKVRFGQVTEETEAMLCTVLTLLIKTLSIPAETLLTWAQP